ncbi:MAG: hypothetical protein LBB62_05125 [Proteiniphilum sp.]|jgi:hypothetical protein|nr:hypothetical protein [Proteiniphilum sp.]
MGLEYYLTEKDMSGLLERAVEIGVGKGLEYAGTVSRYISQNEAYRRFRKSRVRNWVKDGMIKGKPNGNGKTSTVYYEFARLLELDASDKIVIRKAYIPDKEDKRQTANKASN